MRLWWLMLPILFHCFVVALNCCCCFISATHPFISAAPPSPCKLYQVWIHDAGKQRKWRRCLHYDSASANSDKTVFFLLVLKWLKTIFIRVIVVAYNNFCDFYCLSCNVFLLVWVTLFLSLSSAFKWLKQKSILKHSGIFFLKVSQLRQWSAPLRYQPSKESTKK